MECENEYIGDSSRTFGERYKEHLKALSSIFEQECTTGHMTTVDNFKIIGREGHYMAKAIKEKLQLAYPP